MTLPRGDTAFSKDVVAKGTMPPAQVVEEVLAGFERDVLGVLVGSAAQLNEIYRRSPDEVVERDHAMTGGP